MKSDSCDRMPRLVKSIALCEEEKDMLVLKILICLETFFFLFFIYECSKQHYNFLFRTILVKE